MKLSVSVPDDLWEAAQLATIISDPELARPATSLVVQRGLQALVARAWELEPGVMQSWLEGKQERIRDGIARLVKGKERVGSSQVKVRLRSAKGTHTPRIDSLLPLDERRVAAGFNGGTKGLQRGRGKRTAPASRSGAK